MTGHEANASRRVLLLGATGTIGRGVCEALVHAGHAVTCFIRQTQEPIEHSFPAQVTIRMGEVTSEESLRVKAFAQDRFDVVVSCLGSRTGAPQDAWAVDHRANATAVDIAAEFGVDHFILLSAICVQKPKLTFQYAKLAAERHLIDSGMTYSIVRPTAFFKSLSGQIRRLREGKAFLVFGHGELTACKPISNRDLGTYIAQCISQESRWNAILPIGGPGEAITPKKQGELLFNLLGRNPQYRHMPVWVMDTIIFALSIAGKLVPAMKNKAELARIGRYYATESMLVWDEQSGRYSETLTPSTGSERLEDFYRDVIRGELTVDLGDHAIF